MADFRFENHGTVTLVTPLNDDAKEFISESVNVEPWQWMGKGIGMDTRMAIGFREIILDAGFSYH